MAGFGARTDGYKKPRRKLDTKHKVFGWKTQAKILEGKKANSKGVVDAVPFKTPVLVEEFDIHKKIQTFADETNINTLVKRALMTGDSSIISSHKGEYADVSGFSNDRVDLHSQASSNAMNGLEGASKLGLEPKEAMSMTKQELEAFITNTITKLTAGNNTAEKGKDTHGQE